jgi:hypothetical protein
VGDEREAADSTDAAALSRRRVLQAGVATGVAAATMWSAPKIVAAAPTPANGQVCTAPTVKFPSDGKKKNMTCEDGCEIGGTKYLTYKEPYNGGIFDINFSAPSSLPTEDGCSAPPGAPYVISFQAGKGPGPDYTCFIGTFRVFNEATGATKTVTGVPGGIAPVLTHADEGNCAWFYGDVTVECCPTKNLK